MSKTIDSLNQIQAQKQNEYSVATTKEPTIKNNGDTARVTNLPSRDSRIRITWIFGFLFFILLISILGFNFKLYSMSKSYTSERGFTLTKLNKIEELINRNNKQANDNLAAINSLNQEHLKKTSQLEKTIDTQAAAIENLTKAKNTLFKRVTELETKQGEKN